MEMLERNNLHEASSPYLRQHREDPVHWQEWSKEVLEAAKRADKPLLVSVGYSTCHWCHVMAREAFSDLEIAAYLNKNFVPIKVDREERPDIDQYLMDFLVATTGSGGWPLNAFLSPEGAPFFAMTYAPVEPKFRMPGFKDILEKVVQFYREKKGELKPYKPEEYAVARRKSVQEGGYDEAVDRIRSDLYRRYDTEFAGFGDEQKFPPHPQLLYLLFDGVASAMSESVRLAEQTLDTIYLRGLHDHLQGGFFRYCVDREWTIPHFEKMLYDQALLLWSFSWGYRILRKPQYLRAIEGTISALEEQLAMDDLFGAGLDADTDHEEGRTYLWSPEELEAILGKEGFDRFARHFESPATGNFEGKVHLVAVEDPQADPEMRKLMDKLLEQRKARRQPERDEKIVTSWNALAGVALIEAGRATDRPEYIARACRLHQALSQENGTEEGVARSSVRGHGKQERGFLEDYAALLLLESYLYEERELEAEQIRGTRDRMLAFRDGENWQNSVAGDFFTIPSAVFDSPVPAPASLAELAELRTKMLLDEEYEELPPARSFVSDFYNIAARFASGEVYLVKAPSILPWKSLPFPSIQGFGERENYCFRGVCYFGLPET